MTAHRMLAFALAGSLWGSAQAAEPTEAPVVVEVALPEKPLAFGARASLPVTVTNRGKAPAAILELALTSELGPAWSEALASAATATLGKVGADVEGLLEAEDIGAQARLPPPPRWRFAGKDAFRTFPVLAPGERLERTASFLVVDGMTRLDVVASWVRADQAWGLKVARWEPIEREPSPGMMGGGVFPIGRLSARFEPGPAHTALPMEALEQRVRLEPHGLPAQAFASLAVSAAKASLGWPVERPHCTKEEAVKRAKVAASQAFYVRALKAWALETEKETVLVHDGRVEKAPGRLVAAFTALMESEKTRIDVFSWAPQKDVDGLAAHLQSKGFGVQVREQKGGTWQADVEVDAAGLVRLASALGKKGRFIEGTRVGK